MDDPENGQDAEHGEGEEEPLGTGPENLADDQIGHGNWRCQHPIVDFVVFQTDKRPVGAFKRSREHGRRDQQTAAQKLDIGQPFHGRGNVLAQPQAHTEQKQQRFQKQFLLES